VIDERLPARLEASPGAQWIERPWIERPWIERPGIERPGIERPGIERPGIERPWIERPWIERPWIERPGGCLRDRAPVALSPAGVGRRPRVVACQ